MNLEKLKKNVKIINRNEETRREYECGGKEFAKYC